MKPNHNDTMLLLTLRYQAPAVRLETVLQDYDLGINLATARRMAGSYELPFPVFRGSDSNKAGWLVNLTDLAVWLDRRAAQARKTHHDMNSM